MLIFEQLTSIFTEPIVALFFLIDRSRNKKKLLKRSQIGQLTKENLKF